MQFSQFKNTSIPKPQEQPLPSTNMNPFFEYVSNNTKPPNNQVPLKFNSTQSETHLQTNYNSNRQSQRNQQVANNLDLKKAYQNVINGQSQPEKVQVRPARKQQRPFQSDLKERRSRSREKDRYPKRENSEQSKKRQKKQEHYHKTKLCPLFQKGQCKRGQQCNFAHGEKQLRILPNFAKTRICIAFQNGQCRKSSDYCKYAHGQVELRGLSYADGGYLGSHNRQMLNSQYSNTSKDGKSNDYSSNNYKQQRYNNQRQERYQKYNRDSESTHRNDNRFGRKSQSREGSKDYRGKRDEHHQRYNQYDRNEKYSKDSHFYKNNVPINKDYKKYLYAESQSKNTQEVNNNAYVIPNSNTFNPNPYGVEPFASYPNNLPLPITAPSYTSHSSNMTYPPPSTTNYVPQVGSLPYPPSTSPATSNLPYQPPGSNNPNSYEKGYKKQPSYNNGSQFQYKYKPPYQRNNSNFNNEKPIFEGESVPHYKNRNKEGNFYSFPNKHNSREHSSYYQNQHEPLHSNFSKDSYKPYNKQPNFGGQSSYSSQPYQSYNSEPYPKPFSKDTQFSQTSQYLPPHQKNASSNFSNQNNGQKQQFFYGSDQPYGSNLNSSSYNKKNFGQMVNNSFSGQTSQSVYPPPSNTLEIYPALDTGNPSGGQSGGRFARNFQKKPYSYNNFSNKSNNMQNR